MATDRFAGTLKVEVIKPHEEDSRTWDEVGPRLRALRATVAEALTLTQREVYGEAVESLEAFRVKAPNATQLMNAWKAKTEPLLRKHWNTSLVRRFEYLKGEEGKPKKLKKNGAPVTKALRDDSFLPVTEYLTAETRDNLLSRWTGEPLKQLLASKVSVPSWKTGCAFSARSRACEVAGTPERATLTFPLWGAGDRATKFVVVPCGDGHRALWRRLVKGEDARREIQAEIFKQRSTLTRIETALGKKKLSADQAAKDKKSIVEQIATLEERLKNLGGMKLGRVGLTFDDRKSKWYALISWTRPVEEVRTEGISAAAHMGVNVFLQALSEEGDFFRVDGADILVTRRRFAHRRKNIQANLNTMGSGSHGHGRARRDEPITGLQDPESRYMETKNGQIAAALIDWCLRHGIATLYLEDHTGLREAFETKTKGEAHEEVKRMVHSWAFAQLRQAVERQGQEKGIKVVASKQPYVGQRCPDCGHTSPDNVRQVAGRREDIVYHGRSFSRAEKRSVFQCIACRTKGDGDAIAVANMLIAVGCKNPTKKAFVKAREEFHDKVEGALEGAAE